MNGTNMRSLTLGLALGAGTACSESSGLAEPWFELGWGQPFEPFGDGDRLEMQIGSQGARMFPVAVRAAGFEPSQDKRGDHSAPARIDIRLVGPRGVGESVAIAIEAAPLDLRPQEDGTMIFYYVPLIPPDATPTTALDGPATLGAELDLEGAAAAEFAVQVVLEGGAR